MATEPSKENINGPEETNRSFEATERALEEFQERLEAGEDLDEKEFLRQHPDLTDEIGMVFEWLGNLKHQRERSDEGDVGDSSLFGCPRVLGDFRIIRHIGSGGMANVYEAEQIRLNRRVALKVLAPQLALSEKAILKFKREAEAAGRQNHPGVISIFDVGEQDGFYYIAAELVEGERSLADHIDELRAEGDLPRGYFRKTAELIASAAAALQHAHDSNVIHRDVKPSNILIDRDGQPKISDFGLAKMGDALALSRSGDFAGTPYYMSPEQVVPGRKGIDHRTDIFSLGVTLYEALTLERPFEAETSHQILRKIQLHEAKDLQKVDARLPRALSLICRKAMEKDPDHRYQTMAELAGELRRFLAGESILTKPAGLWRKSFSVLRRHKLASVTLGALLVAALSMAILAFVVSGQREREYALAESRYNLAGEAMGLDFRFETMCRWCLEADLRDPSGDMALAICHIESQQYENAIDSLDACLSKSRGSGHGALEREARYLLAVAQLRRAESIDPVSGEKESLVARAEENLSQAGTFDPLSPKTLFWRYQRNTPGDEEAEPWFRKPLKINEKHYLADLCLGLTLFRRLHLGGERTSFEKAIRHLERVLEERPDSVVALTFLARVYFFYARHYDTFQLLGRSRKLLLDAQRLTGNQPYPMIYTTLGQVALLTGRTPEAMEFFEDASTAGELRAEGDPNAHNIKKGIGMVYARQGDLVEAFEWIDEGLALMPADPPLHVAKALLLIEDRKPGQAIGEANRAKDRRRNREEQVRRPTYYASAFLVCALAHTAQKKYSSALNNIWRLVESASQSPRNQSLACIMIAAFPPEIIEGPDYQKGVRRIVKGLAESAGFENNDGNSPVIFSSIGAAALLKGDFRNAIDSLEQAIATRAKFWPDDVQKFHWPEEVRDLYLLAMAHCRLAETEGGDESDRLKGREYLDRAEEIYSRSQRLVEEGGLVDMVRHRARVELGLEKEKGDIESDR